jgi:hypothetical protein
MATRGGTSSRGVKLSFALPGRMTVVVRVDQVAPRCRYVGKFLVRGRPGRNILRFRGRVRGRRLAPGTYRLIAHPRGQRTRRLERATVVVFPRAPRSAAEVRAARRRNECAGRMSPSEAALIAAPATATGGSSATPASKGVAAAAAGTPRHGLLEADGPIRGPLRKAAGKIEDAAREVPPALFAIGALAVLLLGVASLPQFGGSSRAGALLVHKRTSITVAGTGALVTAVVTYLLLITL